MRKKLLAGILICCLCISYIPSASLAEGGVRVVVNPSITYQEWEGFGISLAWWANIIGGWSEEKVDEIVDLAFDLDKGLGLNVARFNIGGGDAPGHDHMILGANMPSYQPEPGVWDWEADENQRKVLIKALERGVNITEAFSNSPPYWMTRTGCTAGGHLNGPNLLGEHYQNFADYLTEVVKQYDEIYDIQFDYLSPINEHDGWWVKGGKQEGTTWDIYNMAGIYYDLHNSLVDKGIDIKVSGLESSNVDWGVFYLKTHLGDDTKQYIDKYNTHTYHGTKRDDFRYAAERDGKELWMSEVCIITSGPHDPEHKEMGSSLLLSDKIMRDIREIQPTVWAHWLLMEGEEQCIDADKNFNLIHANYGDNTDEEYHITKQYYTMGQFSKFIRPGDTFIDVSNDQMLATMNEEEGRVTLVIQNTSHKDVMYNLDMSLFNDVGERAEVYRTSENEDIARIEDIQLHNKKSNFIAKAHSISTIVFDQVSKSIDEEGFVETFEQHNSQLWWSSDGRWEEENGLLKAREIQQDQFYINKNAVMEQQFIYEGDITINKEDTAAGLLFRSDLTGKKGYVVTLDHRQQIIKLFKTPYEQIAWAGRPIEMNKPNHIKVVAEGDHIQVFVNDESKPTFDLYDSTYSTGYFGVNCYEGAASYDNLELKEDEEVSQLFYYVDCGDNNPTVLEYGETLGSHNSKEDQPYGVDSVTSKSWGYETFGATYIHDVGDNNYDSVRVDEGDTPLQGITYKFQLEENRAYKVTIGYRDFWENPWRPMDIGINGNLVTEDLVVNKGVFAIEYSDVQVIDGMMTIDVKRTEENWGKHTDPMVSWIKIELDS